MIWRNVIMKLSEQTVSILKNFSTINQNLVIKEGSEISTMSAMKNIVSKSKVEETFPVEFAIYDLNEFLSAMSLFTNPDLDFNENFVVITEAGSNSKSLKYWYSEPSVVTTPSKEITMPSVDVEFPMNSGILSEVQKAAAVIGAPDMVLEDDELRVTDKKNDTANSYSTSLDTKSDDDASYKFWFKVENLKLLPGDYDVQVSEKRISHFQNKKTPIEYWIALEPESSYGN
jgi:gp45 sliding clamp, C terminal./DNA polymerase processivity factor.